MGRPLAAAIVVALGTGLLAASCGGSSDGAAAEGAPGATTTSGSAATIEQLWRAPGEDVAAVPGTSDNAVGSNRISFLVVDKQSKLIERPTARVWISRGLKQPPYAETTARLEPIGVPGGESAGANGIYVATLRTPTAGTYWYLAEPIGGTKIQALGNMVVRKQSAAPGVGDRAIASKTPTLASTGGDLHALTTSRRPDRALYTTSVAQALATHEPFVVAFATPQYCQSRTCGPVVDTVTAVRKQPASSGVRFIHVEIYKDNDPAKGVNQWVSQWRLPTEPFTFVVDRKGVIRARLEGAFSVDELARAVAKVR
ncbi:MAG TPA: hypothetical protein VHR46_10580 [Gaiella sp.]|nr:hypothetical protein [Gaiella sp.]